MSRKATAVSTILATWIGIVSAITGGFFALQAYRADVAKRIDDRTLITFDLIKIFHSADMRGVRKPALDMAYSYLNCKPLPSNRDDDPLPLFTFVEFFDIVQSCIEANLCNSSLARQYFSPTANGHFEALKRHIEAVRSSESGQDLPNPYGHGLEQLATNPLKGGACR
jgi:hypothetical protein